AARPERQGTWSAERYDIGLRGKRGAESVTGAIEEALEPLRGNRLSRLRRRDAKVYPSKARSLLLSFKNLAFPFRNLSFGMGIGLIYWLVTWQYYSIVSQHDISA